MKVIVLEYIVSELLKKEDSKKDRNEKINKQTN